MDFGLYARVLWRFRFLVAVGAILATSLASLSVVRVSSDGLTYRQSQLWMSNIRLLVTQTGFPEGRLYAQTRDQTSKDQPVPPGVAVADPARFNVLAILYAQLATSDPVRRLMLKEGPARGRIIAQPLRDEQSGTLLPLMDLTTISQSPRGAITLAERAARALNTYLSDQQRVNQVPSTDRVVLQTLVQPREAELYQPRSKTIAIVVFLVVMLATFGLALLLENTRPRNRAIEDAAEAGVRRTKHRRTA
jgi:hypothetical protein